MATIRQRRPRTQTVESVILESSTERRRSRSSTHFSTPQMSNLTNQRSLTPSPSHNAKRRLLPTPVRNRSDSMPRLSSSSLHTFTQQQRHHGPNKPGNGTSQGRKSFFRSSSLESLDDEEEHRLEPMVTVKCSPRDNKSATPASNVEFWSKNTAKRCRRSSVSALCPYPDLLDTTRHLRSNITVGSRRKVIFGTKHTQVFSGKTATNFLRQYICDDSQDSSEEAKNIGTWMMREQFIGPVDGKAKTGGSGKSGQMFSSSAQALYRFNDAMLSPYHLHVIVHQASGLLGKKKRRFQLPLCHR